MRRHIGSIAILFIALAGGCSKKEPAPVVADDNPPDNKGSVEAHDKSKEQAIANLKNKEPEKRALGVRAISQLDGADAIPVLLEIMADKGFTEWATRVGEPNSSREAAMLALLKLGAAGEKAAVERGLPILAAGLKDSNAGVKEHTIVAISLLGLKAKSQAGNLLQLCEDGNEIIRQAAFTALAKIGSASALDYALMLTNADPKIAYDVAKAINALRTTQPLPKEIIDVLIGVIDKPPAEMEPQEATLTRVEVAEILASFGTDAEPALPALIEALKRTTEEDFIKLYQLKQGNITRTGESPTMIALRKIGKPAVPALTKALDPDPEKWFLCYQSAKILAGIGPDASAAIPELQKIFDVQVERLDVNFALVDVCALAIVQLGGEHLPIIAKIVELLKISNTESRVDTASTLSLFGRKGASATPAMIKLLDDTDENVRQSAIMALKAFGPGAKEAIPALAVKLTDKDLEVRRATAATIKEFGPVAAEVTPTLAKLLSDPDDSFRREVIEAITAIGSGAKAAVPELIKLIKAVDPRERDLAIAALGAIGAEAKTAAPVLAAALGEKGGELDTKVLIGNALGQIGDAAPEVVKALVARAEGRQDEITHNGLGTPIAQLGPSAKSAVADLQTFGGKLKDSPSAVWAAVALYKIGIDTSANLQLVVSALKNKAPAAKQARLAAMDAADLLGAGGKGVIAELIDALSDNTPISQFDKNSPPVRIASHPGPWENGTRGKGCRSQAHQYPQGIR